MAKVIARIRLAKGETGYYDEKSGIFLNWKHPEADVMEGTDCSGLRVSHRCHRIKVLSGSLGKPKSLKRILAESKAKRLGVPVEHILHKGKKLPVYVETAESEAAPVVEDGAVKAEPAKAEKSAAKEASAAVKVAPSKEKAEEKKADVTETKAKEAKEDASIKGDKAEDKPKKTTRRRRTTKKADAEDKAAEEE